MKNAGVMEAEMGLWAIDPETQPRFASPACHMSEPARLHACSQQLWSTERPASAAAMAICAAPGCVQCQACLEKYVRRDVS